MAKAQTMAPIGGAGPRSTPFARGAPRFLRNVAGTPITLLFAVWAAAVALYLLGPVTYGDAPTVATWLFVLGCILAFSLGSWLSKFHLRNRGTVTETESRAWKTESVTQLAAVVGLLGAAFIVVDKFQFSGLDFSQGVAALRFAREQSPTSEVQRTPLLLAGYLTFCFSVAAFLLYLLRGEEMRRRTLILAYLSLLSIFAYSYVYGGRSPLGLVVGMALGAVLVRKLAGRAAVPAGTLGRLLFIGYLAATVAYSETILAERIAYSGVSDFATLESRFETSNNARIDPVPGTAPQTAASSAPASTPVPSATSGASASTAARVSLPERIWIQLAVNSFYFTHELPVLHRMLHYEGELGPYFGAYEFYFVGSSLNRLAPSLDVDADMIPELKAANVYGYYSTAWGGMYLDFGLIGGLVVALLLGWIAGRIYRQALFQHDPAAQLLMCYVIAGIIATPLLSIFTISISLPILFALIVVAVTLRISARRTAQSLEASVDPSRP